MSEAIKSPFFCSVLSTEKSEPIFGTAVPQQTFLLLEYTGMWNPQILPRSDLSAEVKNWLSGQLKVLPRPRLLFVKCSDSPVDCITFYIVNCREKDPFLLKYQLEKYEDLLKLDVPKLLQSNTPNDNSLLLVCTHGKHDRCCAKFGLPVYQELRKQCGDSVWQCSHVGGDRFAGNVLSLPFGISYGHVTTDEANLLYEKHLRKEILLDKYRGRACYTFVTQAADYYLRQYLSDFAYESFRLLDVKLLEKITWQVTFVRTNDETQQFRVTLTENPKGYTNYLSCDAQTVSSVPSHSLLDITQL